MATVALVPDVITDAGKAANYNGGLSTGNTYTFRNANKTLLHFKKSGANACTVSITVQKTLKGKAVAAQTVNVPATTGDVFVGPFDHELYDDVNHDISFTLSEVTGLTVAVIQAPA